MTLTETAQGKATGVSTTPARYATGQVVFTHWCATLPGGSKCLPTYAVPAGSVLWNNQGTMTYVLLAGVTCFCGESVSVRAWSRGSIGNAAAHSVGLRFRTSGFTYYETADNPRPLSGGVDATSSPFVTKADFDAATSDLVARLSAALKASLEQKAGGLHYESDPPTIATTSDSSIGARNATFQVTATGSMSATVFSDADARSLILRALAAAIPTGWRLVEPASIDEYDVKFSSVRGDVTVTGTARGYAMKQVDVRSLPLQLRGLDSKAAARTVEAAAPGCAVEIRIAPVTAPWLPLNPAHIAVVVLPAPRSPLD